MSEDDTRTVDSETMFSTVADFIEQITVPYSPSKEVWLVLERSRKAARRRLQEKGERREKKCAR